MKNIQNILIGILGLAVLTLFYLQFKSNSSTPRINLNPSQKEMASTAGSKVVFVNIDSFFDKYKEYKKIKSEIESTQKSSESNIQNKMKALESDYMKLVQQAQGGQITPQQAQVKEKEIVARKNKLEEEGRASLNTISNKLDKATKDLYKKIGDYFLANKEKYNCDYVMGYQTNGVLLYFDPKLDVTAELTEDLNKE